MKDYSKDWPAFFAACVNDEPKKPVIELVNSLYFNSCEIIYPCQAGEEYMAGRTSRPIL